MLTVQMLGHFEMAIDGQRLHLPTRVTESVAAWLLLHPGVSHRREKVAETLWPEIESGSARGNLRRAIWRLRQTIPPDYLRVDHWTVGWNVEAAYRLDVDLFSKMTGPEATPHQLVAGLDAYRGELLPGFYDEWVIRKREWLASLYDERVERLLEHLLAAGEWRQAIERAEGWIARGHTPEPAYRALMQAHAALGDRSAAQAAYQRCVHALESELGVPPSPETVALAQSIHNSQFTIHHLQFPTPHPPPTNLPAPTTPLVGREGELAALAVLLTDPQHRLVTILGPGGIGKSRLALAAGHAALEHFPDGVFLVELAPLSHSEEIPQAIAIATGYPLQGDRPPRQQLPAFLAQRKVLLVLDNCEHILDGVGFLIELLQAASGLHLLVTSRERLHVQAEKLLLLDGLTYPSSGLEEETDSAYSYSALTLFAQCVQRLRRAFAPTDDDWQAITRICRMVDGMPLGIILAAGWADALSLAEIADEISTDAAFLAQELRDLEPRHRSIGTVFEHSWQRLAVEKQQALAALAVFSGGFDRNAAEAIAGASLPILFGLIDRALIWKVADQRFNLHELVRQFARKKLTSTGQEQRRRALHSRWFLALVAQQEARLKGREQEQATRLLEKEEANVRVAWEWAADSGEWDQILRAVESLGIFHNRPDRWEKGAMLMGRAIAGLTETPEQENRILLARLLAWLGVFELRIGKVTEARANLTETLQMASDPLLDQADVRALRAFVLLHRGDDLLVNRSRSSLVADLEQAANLFETHGDPWWLARSQFALGNALFHNGQTQLAEEQLAGSLRLAQQTGDSLGEAQAVVALSFLTEQTGRFEESDRMVRERSVPEFAHPLHFSDFKYRMVSTAIGLGQFERALTLVTERLAYARSLGVGRNHLQFAFNSMGRVRLHLGNFQEAYALASSAAQEWANFHGWPHPYFRRTMGMALLAEGKVQEAQKILSDVRADHQRVGADNLFRSGAWVDETYPYLARGDLAQARHCLMEGLRIARQTGAYRFTVQALPAAALLLAWEERLEVAGYLTGSLQRYPYLTNSRWYATVALDRLSELLAPLPADVRAAAEARGRALELPELTAELLALL